MIDRSGYPLVISHWHRRDWFKKDETGKQQWQSHITELEPEISRYLIDRYIMIARDCADISTGRIKKTYLVIF